MRIKEITEYVRQYVHPDVEKQLKKYEKRAQTIGVAEHIDYVATAEKKLESLAGAEDKLKILKDL